MCLSRLTEHESQWKQYINKTNDEEVLVADTVIAAAFLTYCGGFDIDLRYGVCCIYAPLICHSFS